MGSNTNSTNEDDLISEEVNSKADFSQKLEIAHSDELINDIGSIFNSSDYSDCTIKIRDTEFHLHKAILASRSKYFRAMFFGGLSVNNGRPIEIHENDPSVFEHILRYIYTGSLKLVNTDISVHDGVFKQNHTRFCCNLLVYQIPKRECGISYHRLSHLCLFEIVNVQVRSKCSMTAYSLLPELHLQWQQLL
ncbi:hypothetical protein GJ496_002099 [Pomphorhynchus laevis]|nr:hypothetical protein GJ496_002099 [Pomphorhynchus laevis]